MNEKIFCEIYTQLFGEEINSINQIKEMKITGEDLYEIVKDMIRLFDQFKIESHSCSNCAKIKKKQFTYVTTMHRWGDTDTHSYLIYAGNSKHKAMLDGQEERDRRGGKYEYEVTEFDKDCNRKIVINRMSKNELPKI